MRKNAGEKITNLMSSLVCENVFVEMGQGYQ